MYPDRLSSCWRERRGDSHIPCLVELAFEQRERDSHCTVNTEPARCVAAKDIRWKHVL